MGAPLRTHGSEAEGCLMPGITLSTAEDGRPVYEISQSWLGSFFNCPEQARLEMEKELPRSESDATAIGTAVHAGIESVLLGATLDEGAQSALATFMGLTQLDGFRWVQIKTQDTAERTVLRCFWAWANEIYPQLPTIQGVEQPFNVVLWDGPDRQIRLAGTIDCVTSNEDGSIEIFDWKTANRPYEEWEAKRFKIQPTVYTYALAQEHGEDVEYDFTYAVMLKSKQDVQLITVQRDARHWDWLREQVAGITHMIDADLPVWPLRDQHALCSPVWCPAWENCKGAHGL